MLGIHVILEAASMANAGRTWVVGLKYPKSL